MTLNKLKAFFLLAWVVALPGCQTAMVKLEPPATISALDPQAIKVSICRPKSAMRFVETPDFEINGKVVAELGNGTRHEIVLRSGDNFRVNLPKNFLMQRFSDTLIFEGVADRGGHIYMMLATDSKPDVRAGVEALFFGAITASAWQKMRETGKNWHIHPLTADSFESSCSR